MTLQYENAFHTTAFTNEFPSQRASDAAIGLNKLYLNNILILKWYGSFLAIRHSQLPYIYVYVYYNDVTISVMAFP